MVDTGSPSGVERVSVPLDRPDTVFHLRLSAFICGSPSIPTVSAELGQVSMDQRVDLAFHDGDDVSRLGVGAVVLDERVGLEHVAADLIAPFDGALLAAQL